MAAEFRQLNYDICMEHFTKKLIADDINQLGRETQDTMVNDSELSWGQAGLGIFKANRI
jgi:hypothetical protein